MKNTIIVILLAFGSVSAGCSSIEIPGAISTHDLNQADILNDWLSQEPAIKGRFSVDPGADEIVVRFKDDLPEGRTPVFKERLIKVKESMHRDLGKPINTLVFEFPSQTIRI